MKWDPASYLGFAEQRSRPFHDLLARVGAQRPRRVVDLGCGPGHLTPLLAQRWPDAVIEAFDSSAEMVERARAGGVEAVPADAGDWHPAGDTDIVVSNAVLHWVPGHRDLLRRWLGELPPGAWFALQVPGSYDSPSHRLVRELVAEPRWRERLDAVERWGAAEPAEYAQLLAGAGAEVDAWETTYLHRLTGADPVLDWITGSALRPMRAALDDEGWNAFRAELGPPLRAAYPPQPDGTTWFPFRRIFAVAYVPI